MISEAAIIGRSYFCKKIRTVFANCRIALVYPRPTVNACLYVPYAMLSAMPLHFTELIIATGYVGVTSVIFLESGTPLGFFLPGDSLLFTIGFLASQHLFNIYLLLLLMIPAAILGNLLGYRLGEYLGERMFLNEQARFLKPKYLLQAKLFFEEHGSRAIFFARFVPIVRCFVPIVAGAAKMERGGFVLYTILGAISWAGGVTLLGFFLGKSIPHAEQYLLPIIVLIIILSLIPTLWHFWKERFKVRKTDK